MWSVEPWIIESDAFKDNGKGVMSLASCNDGNNKGQLDLFADEIKLLGFMATAQMQLHGGGFVDTWAES